MVKKLKVKSAKAITGEDSNTGAVDKRSKCCHGGTRFFKGMKSMLSRWLFVIHSVVAIYKVALENSPLYWLLTLMFIGIFVEAGFVLTKRKNKEWGWFQLGVFFYLLCVTPCIWALELQRLKVWESGDSNDAVSSEGLTPLDAWTLGLEQSLLLVIILARWLMPRGELTRDQISSLLLVYIGTASDMVDFITLMSEDSVRRSIAFVYAVLAIWTWSLMQFPFVTSATVKEEDAQKAVKRAERAIDEESDDDQQEKKGRAACFGKWTSCMKSAKEHFVKTEAWSVFVSVLMQDGPFVIMRLIASILYGVSNYTHYFFTCKNVLVLCLQIYRFGAVYAAYSANKVQITDEMRSKRRTSKMLTKSLNVIRAARAFSNSIKKPSDVLRRPGMQHVEDIEVSCVEFHHK